MIAAERLLFASALEDLANQRFVLLSDRYASLRIITHPMLSLVLDLIFHSSGLFTLFCV